jgi:BirA family transcriptional regulator, biotin operon repressor / biotin---[acetyl-CoA-carboxylase] ligase
MPAWNAVRAGIQTSGRGRTGRAWTSDEGGLWLSGVLPCPGNRDRWSILPLAAGWAIIGMLKEIGVRNARLRWPNDIMIGQRKLAGLLAERYSADTAVVGVGLNVSNSPEVVTPALRRTTTRLVDQVPGDYALNELAVLVLKAIARAHDLIITDRFHIIADELNAHWANPRLVAVTLTGHAHPFTGLFNGIDSSGRLRVSTDYSGIRYYDAAQVALLRELE